MQSRLHLSILFLLSVTYQTTLQSNPAAARAALAALRQSRTQISQQARRHLSKIRTSGEEITNAVQLGRSLQRSRIKNSIAAFITGLLTGIVTIEETIYKDKHKKWKEKYHTARVTAAQLYDRVFNGEQELTKQEKQEESPRTPEVDEHPREQEKHETNRTRAEEETAASSRKGEQILELKRKLSQEFINRCQDICSRTRQSGSSELTVSRVNQMIAAFQIQFDTALNTTQSKEKLNMLYEEYFGVHGKVTEIEAHVQKMLASKKETTQE